ncbi:MAG TPA: hypothetical protein VKR22_15245, partial [Acidimicrobiales bacterium]|nr:hypothetical protein [Acidimicrobiales bacterium]
ARYRFDVSIRRRGQEERSQLAEDVGVHAFTGLPASPAWLSADQIEEVLAATPTGNLGPEQRTQFLDRTLDGADNLTRHLAGFAAERAGALAKQHNRVREESSATRRATVTPHLPVDVLGMYILVPT